MKDLRSDSFFRLETLLLLLNGSNGQLSISSLSELLGISLEMLRRDIRSIYQSKDDSIELAFLDGQSSIDMDEIGIDDTQLLKNLESGAYDHDHLYVSLRENKDIELILDAEEYDCLSDFLNQQKELINSRKMSLGSCLFKDSISSITEAEWDKVRELDLIIEDGLGLLIRYLTGEGELIERTIFPVRIAHDVENHFLYIVDDQLRFYRFDRIRGIKKVPSKHRPEGKPADLSILDHMWGTGLTDPVHVKVRIYDEAGVPQRVKADLGRKADGHLYQWDGYYFYEDDVIGINRFCSWVYGYGSSMVVEEPESLRKRIENSIIARLEEII